MEQLKIIGLLDIINLKPEQLKQINILSWFTNISLILVIFYKYTQHLFDLLLLTWIILFISIWIVYVKPRRLSLYPTNIYIQGVDLQIGHIIFHVIPFMAMVHLFKDKQIDLIKTGMTAAFALLYLPSHDVKEIYGLERQEILSLGLVAVIMYFAIHK